MKNTQDEWKKREANEKEKADFYCRGRSRTLSPSCRTNHRRHFQCLHRTPAERGRRRNNLWLAPSGMLKSSPVCGGGSDSATAGQLLWRPCEERDCVPVDGSANWQLTAENPGHGGRDADTEDWAPARSHCFSVSPAATLSPAHMTQQQCFLYAPDNNIWKTPKRWDPVFTRGASAARMSLLRMSHISLPHSFTISCLGFQPKRWEKTGVEKIFKTNVSGCLQCVSNQKIPNFFLLGQTRGVLSSDGSSGSWCVDGEGSPTPAAS